MIEVLKNFEQEVSRFSPLVLIVPGLALVAFGLIAWLAGMCLRRLVLAGAGAAAGGLAGWLLYGPNPTAAGLAAGGGAVFAAVLPRLSTAVLLAAFSVAVAFLITARTHFVEGPKSPGGRPGAGRGETRLSGPESLVQMRVFALDLVGRTKVLAGETERASLAILAAAGLVLLAGGFLFTRLAGALAFSILGTILIFAGLVLLLMYKGSAPVTSMQNRGAFYGLVVLGMAAFGAVEQLVLCPAPHRRRKAKSGPVLPARRESEHGWRNH